MGLLATFYRTLHSVPCPPPKSNLVETFLVEQLNGRRFLAQILKYFCFTFLTMWTRIFGWTWNLSVSNLTHFDYFMDYCTVGSRNTSLTETDLLWVTSPFPSQALLQGPWNKANKRLHQWRIHITRKYILVFLRSIHHLLLIFPGYPVSFIFSLSNFDKLYIKTQSIWCVGK